MENNINFDELQNLIDTMYEGNKMAIINGLRHKGALMRINAIFAIADNAIKDANILQMVKELKKDATIIDGNPVSDYATGLLEVYGMDKYAGNSNYIKNLIKDKMIIY